MIKSVNIDGKNYIIESCESCPFYDWGDEGYHDHCQYPVNPSTLKEHTAWGMDCIAKDCPLGLTKDCFTCKYEEHKDDGTGPCGHCMISFDSVTGKQSDPSMWEVKD